MDCVEVVRLVRKHLTDDLRIKPWIGNKNKYAGHCYVASEACLYFLGPDWKPESVKHEGFVHWYLRHRKTGKIIDPTVDQFKNIPEYRRGRGRGFLTKRPSKRAQILIDRCKDE